MNERPKKHVLTQSIHRALVDPHVADNEDLLARWSLGVLEPGERRAIDSHLETCSECREIVGLMIDTEALELPEGEPIPAALAAGRAAIGAEHVRDELPEAEHQPPAGSKPQLAAKSDRQARRRSRTVWTVVTVAASLFLAASAWVLWPRTTAPDVSLALTDFNIEYDGERDGRSKGGGPLTAEPNPQLEDLAAEVARQPNSAQLRFDYGVALLQAGKKTDAEEQFNHVLDVEPKNAYARAGLGVALFGQDRIKDALAAFDEAAKVAPDRWDLQLNLAICLEKLDRTDQAVPHWSRAAKLAPDSEKPGIETYIACSHLARKQWGLDQIREHTDSAGRILDAELATHTGWEILRAFRWTLESESGMESEEFIPTDAAKTLRTGQRFRLLVETSCDLHIYVLVLNADGSLAVLVPEQAGEAPLVRKGESVRLPRTDVFRLTPPAGRERLRILASPKPLSWLTSRQLWELEHGDSLTDEQQEELARLKGIRTESFAELSHQQDEMSWAKDLSWAIKGIGKQSLERGIEIVAETIQAAENLVIYASASPDSEAVIAADIVLKHSE